MEIAKSYSIEQAYYKPESIISHHINYKEVLPVPALCDDIKYYWIMEAKKPLPFLVNSSGISKGYIDLIFTFEGNFCKNGENYLFGSRDFRFYIVGPLTQAQTISSAGAVTAIGIRFKPGKAFPYLRFPLSQITDQVVPIADAWYFRDNSILDRLMDEPDLISKITLVENWLLRQKYRNNTPPGTINHALNLIHYTKGKITVEELGESLDISFRHLQRKFLEVVGIPPKLLCKITKVRHAIDIINHQLKPNWLDIVYRCGFYDQPHFIRDFKAVTGITPGNYCSEPSFKYTILSNMSDLYNTSSSRRSKLHTYIDDF